MSTKTLHGQMTVIDTDGNIKKLHQETSAQDVLIKKDSNTQNAIPSDVENLQNLSDKLGNLAFKSNVENSDLVGNFVVVDETDEGVAPPESEINDDVISSSLTWSSNKIDTKVTALTERIEEVNNTANSIFYIHLVEDSSGTYTAQETVAEIEAAYNENKAIWVAASNILIPLRKRQNANTWIFSGYTETQAYDITITATAVTFTYTDLVTANDALPNPNPLKLMGAVSAVYDGSEEVEVEIPQHDWNQNDETAVDYIKNRTHYEIIAKTDIAGTTYTVENVSDTNLTVNFELPLELGQEWKVSTPSGESEYTLSVQENENGDLYMGDPDCTEVPYYITPTSITLNSDCQNTFNISELLITGVVGSITGESTIKQLDEKYIPDTIARTMDENDALELLAEIGLIEPITDESGNILTDENGVLYAL